MRIRRHWNADVVDADSLVCKNCVVRLLTNHLIDWWAIQVNELNVIAGESLSYLFLMLDNRPKCWYGVE